MFGRIIFLLIFVVSGILANLGTFFAFENAPVSLGASGAICGLYGAYTYYYWTSCITPTCSALRSVRRMILLNVFQAYFGTEKDINHYAHAYGYIAGIGIATIAVALRD